MSDKGEFSINYSVRQMVGYLLFFLDTKYLVKSNIREEGFNWPQNLKNRVSQGKKGMLIGFYLSSTSTRKQRKQCLWSEHYYFLLLTFSLVCILWDGVTHS